MDVTIVEGAVSSQDDLEKIQHVRRHTRLLVALGDCAITSNVPAMRNPVPAKKLLERIYVEGVDMNPGVPTEGVPPTAQARRAPSRSGEGGSVRPGLSTAGRRSIPRSSSAEEHVMQKIIIEPVTRIEGHAKG